MKFKVNLFWEKLCFFSSFLSFCVFFFRLFSFHIKHFVYFLYFWAGTGHKLSDSQPSQPHLSLHGSAVPEPGTGPEHRLFAADTWMWVRRQQHVFLSVFPPPSASSELLLLFGLIVPCWTDRRILQDKTLIPALKPNNLQLRRSSPEATGPDLHLLF